MNSTTFRLADLAREVGGVSVGDGELALSGVRALEDAEPSHLSLLTQARYSRAASASRAGALLTTPAWAAHPLLAGKNLLLTEKPAWALARVLELFHPSRRAEPGVHPTAVIAATASVHSEAAIGPYAVVEDGAAIAAGVLVSAHCVVGRGARVGAGSVLFPHVVLYPGVELGEHVVVHAGTVLGADGFGYAWHAGVHVKVPQVGKVVVEGEVEIGALTAIDRATLGETRIGAGTKIDNLVQVGHNVRVGKASILCGQAGIAGSAQLGDGVVLGGQSGIVGHLDVPAGTQVAAKSAVLQPVTAAQVAGVPAVGIKVWRRQVSALGRLPELLRRLRTLEKKVGEEE